jgi:uncharacterized membrane protein
MQEHASADALALERLLFFSDAVFAIAITLLVIEIKLPPLPHEAGDRALVGALVRLVPLFVGFVISFFLIGQTWVEHHKMGRELRSLDVGLLWKNLFLLFFVAFLPFATALLSEHFGTRIAVVVYASTFAGLGLAKAAYWRHAVRRGHVHDPLSAAVGSISRRVWATPLAAAAVAVAASLGVPYAPLGFVAIPLLVRLLDRAGATGRAARAPA